MTPLHLVLGIAVVALFAAAGLVGAWRWWRVQDSVWFWRILRTGQVVLAVEVALGGLLRLTGHDSPGDLHLLYGLLPLGVSFVAEQLRLSAAQTVLDARGLEDAEAVGRLPEDEQRSVVVAVLRRELGVMTLAALFIAGLAVRAALL